MDRLDYAIRSLQRQAFWKDLPLEDVAAALRSLYKGPDTEVTLDEIVEATNKTVTLEQVYQAFRGLEGSPFYVVEASWWIAEDGQPDLRIENGDLVIEALNTDRFVHPTTGRVVLEAQKHIMLRIVTTDWDKPRER